MIRRAFVLLVVLLAAGAAALVVLEKTMPDWYARERYPLRYASIVRGHAQHYHLDPALLAAVIYTESKFNAHSVSSAGAVGLMQLLPDTAKGIALHTGGSGFVISDLDDPEINVRYGAWYLEHLQEKYESRPNATDLALAAYNAGQGQVDHWLAETPPGSPVHIGFAETRAYVARVHQLQAIYRRAYASQLGYAQAAGS
jgi:soluble lytic murein transglycosylase